MIQTQEQYIHDLTNKPSDGRQVPRWYEEKEYGKIENYIINETEQFIEFIEWTYKTVPLLLPNLKDHFKNLL